MTIIVTADKITINFIFIYLNFLKIKMTIKFF